MEIDFNGELLTAFFHATAVWVVNPDGNPYGEPVKFTNVLGKNTATTRENKNVSLGAVSNTFVICQIVNENFHFLVTNSKI